MSTEHTWSGPSRALQCHLDLFDASHREHVLFNNARGGTLSLPKLVRWVDFAKTYSRSPLVIDQGTGKVTGGEMLKGSALYDGRSNAEMSMPTMWDNDEMVRVTAQTMWETEHDLLSESTTFYVSAEMIELVTEAAELSEPEPLFVTDLMEPSGLIVLEEPLMLPDLHPVTGEVIDDLMPIRAIGWRRQEVGKRDGSGSTDGIVLICYDDNKSYNEIYLRKIREIAPELNDEYRLDLPMGAVEFHPWAFGTEWSSVLDISQTGQGKIISGVAFMRRWFLALNRLMWQRLLNPEQWHPNRAGQRQYGRVRGKEAPLATVLYLRRYVEDAQYRKKEDPDVLHNWPYPYRIMVKTHTKRQYFPSLGPARNPDGSFNNESHRRVFILKYPRGPEHLPIRDHWTIQALVR